MIHGYNDVHVIDMYVLQKTSSWSYLSEVTQYLYVEDIGVGSHSLTEWPAPPPLFTRVILNFIIEATKIEVKPFSPIG